MGAEVSNQKTSVYNFLKEKILNCEFLPGDFLNDKDLIEAYGFGRTPIREAIILLQSEGFLEVIPRKGTYIKGLDREEVLQLYELRRTMEPVIASKFITDMDFPRLLSIDSEMREMCEKGDLRENAKEFYALDVEFHTALMESSGNPRMTNMLKPVFTDVYRYGLYNSIRGTERPRKSTYQEHHRILQAILEEDREELVRAYTMHLNVSLLSSLNSLERQGQGN